MKLYVVRIINKFFSAHAKYRFLAKSPKEAAEKCVKYWVRESHDFESPPERRMLIPETIFRVKETGTPRLAGITEFTLTQLDIPDCN